MKKVKVISFFLTLILVTFFACSSVGLFYVYTLVKDLKLETFKYNVGTPPSVILDNRQEVLIELNRSNIETVTYDDLSENFINALVSTEDERFFIHDGIDLPRLLSSAFINLKDFSFSQGGSTIAQQLIKNQFLDNEKKFDRKIKEAYLSLQLQRQYSKEEIITAYSNLILFDGITPGVNHASKRFFAKDIKDVTLPEAILLVAQVKSPTVYNPYINPENTKKRMIIIADLMAKNGYISYEVANTIQNVHVDDLLVEKNTKTPSYPYQSYLDIVYKEAYELTGLNPYTTPMIIETFIDRPLQKELDFIQNEMDKNIAFSDSYQQIGGAVIDNQTHGILGVLGGRNYNAQKLFNRAYDMKVQPASTMKPILSYALAFEHLNWSDQHPVYDVPYTYPNSNIEVKNVDGVYMGPIMLETAIGYSRNTTALSTLEEVINKVGQEKVAQYLKDIQMFDLDTSYVPMSYALGGMTHGVSPIQLAGAYSMLANNGLYSKPTTIKSITLIEENNKKITPTFEEKRVLSEKSAFLTSKTLQRVVNNNYWNIGYVKPDNVQVGAKSGTSNFDASIASQLNYPSNANKDIWFAGFTPDISLAVWTGFDKHIKNEPTYFKVNDPRIGTARKIFKKIIEMKAQENLSFNEPSGLIKVPIVKGSYPYLLPDANTPDNYIVEAYFNPNDLPNKIITPPNLPPINSLSNYIINNKLYIEAPSISPDYRETEYGNKLYSYDKIYGDLEFNVILKINGNSYHYKSPTNKIEIDLNIPGTYTMAAFYQYKKINDLNIIDNNTYITSFDYRQNTWWPFS